MSNTTCPICYEEFEESDNIKKSRCCHSFHMRCYETMIDLSRSLFLRCPICRAIIHNNGTNTEITDNIDENMTEEQEEIRRIMTIEDQESQQIGNVNIINNTPLRLRVTTNSRFLNISDNEENEDNNSNSSNSSGINNLMEKFENIYNKIDELDELMQNIARILLFISEKIETLTNDELRRSNIECAHYYSLDRRTEHISTGLNEIKMYLYNQKIE
jgi:hypothetical protein